MSRTADGATFAATPAQEVSAGQFCEVGVAPSAAGEFDEQAPVAGHVLQPLDLERDPVEIGTEAHVVDAGHVADVLDVVGDVGNCDARGWVIGLPSRHLGASLRPIAAVA